jgi:2'-5' RNA ligase
VRTFVAVELNDACRRALAGAAEALREATPGVRWVRPEAMHLTLKFIGELAEPDLPAAFERLGEVAAEGRPFTMEVAGVSGFPRRGKPRVIHVGVEEPNGALMDLQAAVEEALADELGVAPERRRYVPHVTLGRVKDRRRCPSVAEIAGLLDDQQFGRVEVDRFVLMMSELRPTGAVYTPLHTFPLGTSS